LAKLAGERQATLRVFGDPRQLAPDVSLVLYRVAQEALTNAAKHAPGAPTEVDLDFGAAGVSVSVINGPVGAGGAGGGGRGGGAGGRGRARGAAVAGRAQGAGRARRGGRAGRAGRAPARRRWPARAAATGCRASRSGCGWWAGRSRRVPPTADGGCRPRSRRE